MKVKKWKSLSHVWLFATPWNSPGQNTGVGSCSLPQGIFPAQGLNPGLPHYRQILYQLSHKGSPRILEWVAYPFSSGSSWPRYWTGVSCIAGGFFTNWAIREAQGSADTWTFFLLWEVMDHRADPEGWWDCSVEIVNCCGPGRGALSLGGSDRETLASGHVCGI